MPHLLFAVTCITTPFHALVVWADLYLGNDLISANFSTDHQYDSSNSDLIFIMNIIIKTTILKINKFARHRFNQINVIVYHYHRLT